MTTPIVEATISADQAVPAIHLVRDFRASPEQVVRAHTDPEVFVRWIGPDGMDNEILVWDARNGGEWRYVARRDGEDYVFRGCFHTVREDRVVQTFTFEGWPDGVALETLTVEDLGNGWTRLRTTSLCGSFEERDGMLSSGMEVGVREGYAKLDRLLEDGTV